MSDPSNIPPVHGIPSLEAREEPDFSTCPFCTMQMPTNAPVCPHCNSRNPAARDFREMLIAPERCPRLKAFVSANWQALLLGSGIALAFLVTAIVYYGWVGHALTIVPNPLFGVKVEKRVEDGKVIFSGTVRNLGEDIPDLSLKSVRVRVTFGLDGGGKRVETVFPKNEHRGEGALLRGETGFFRIVTAEDKVESAEFAAEVVDLTCGQPRQNCVVPPIIRTK